MKIMVLGGAGFVGSHVVSELLNGQHEVTVVDDLSQGDLTKVPQAARFVRGDIRTSIAEIVEDIEPEVLVHLAAQVSVPRSVDDPLNDAAVNVGGTINVMNAAARAGVRKVVYMSSAAVYGVPQGRMPTIEDSPTRPVAPYGLSKLCGEHYVRLLGASGMLSYTILRPSNIFGPGQLSGGDGAVIPTFVERFLADADPNIHGDGGQVRDFVYVTDVVHAITQSLTEADGLTINISSCTLTSVLELWQRIARLVNWTRPVQFGPIRHGDIPYSVLANAVARTHLKWAPVVSLDEGLEETIAWAHSHFAGSLQANPTTVREAIG